jgi:hypothetical protein
MLITWGTDGEGSILGMKREMSATDASLVTSSSTNECIGKSCNINNKANSHEAHTHWFDEQWQLNYHLISSPWISYFLNNFIILTHLHGI